LYELVAKCDRFLNANDLWLHQIQDDTNQRTQVIIPLAIIAANNEIKPKSDRLFRFPLTANPKSLVGVATAFPSDSSLSSYGWHRFCYGVGLNFNGYR
jgi:hypothetical protein